MSNVLQSTLCHDYFPQKWSLFGTTIAVCWTKYIFPQKALFEIVQLEVV